MKLHLASDLHLVFDDIELPGGDVLLLAGDICEARQISKNTDTLSDYEKMITERFKRFFREECSKYNKVFYVMGNHEHYGSKYHKTKGLLKPFLLPNTSLLDNECEEYNGILFVGGTLWTDFNRQDSLTMFHAKTAMNDYKQITVKDEVKNVYRKLFPEFLLRKHRETLEYFKIFLRNNKEKNNLPVVMITHHAPCHLSISDKYREDSLMNGNYYSDLSEFILDYPEIKFWVHGHIHDKIDYNVGNTTVALNARGYSRYESTSVNYQPKEILL